MIKVCWRVLNWILNRICKLFLSQLKWLVLSCLWGHLESLVTLSALVLARVHMCWMQTMLDFWIPFQASHCNFINEVYSGFVAVVETKPQLHMCRHACYLLLHCLHLQLCLHNLFDVLCLLHQHFQIQPSTNKCYLQVCSRMETQKNTANSYHICMEILKPPCSIEITLCTCPPTTQ